MRMTRRCSWDRVGTIPTHLVGRDIGRRGDTSLCKVRTRNGTGVMFQVMILETLWTYLQCLNDCFGAGWPGPVSLLYRLCLVMRPRHRHRPRRGLRRLSGIFPAAAQIFLYAVWSDLTKKTWDTRLCYLRIGVGLRQWFTQRIIGADDATHARYI